MSNRIFEEIEIIYDFKPLGSKPSGALSGPINVSVREGSIRELLSKQDPHTIQLYVTTPRNFERLLQESQGHDEALRVQSQVGYLLFEDPREPTTLRQKKRVMRREEYPGFLGYLPMGYSLNDVSQAIQNACERLFFLCNQSYYQSVTAIHEAETQSMHDLGQAFSGNRNLMELSKVVLEKCLDVSQADCGFIFMSPELFEPPHPDGKEVKVIGQIGDVFRLQTKICRGQQVSTSETSLNRRESQLIQHIAEEGRAVSWKQSDRNRISPAPSEPKELHDLCLSQFFQFNKKTYDIANLCLIPILVPNRELVGFLLLINRRIKAKQPLASKGEVRNNTLPFSQSDLALLESICLQAGLSVDRERLVLSLKTVFAGFVTASVKAIESRDPATRGHSVRVAKMTVALAGAANEETEGELAQYHFSPNQLYEIEYAALLHDFGKIVVKESVLQKEKKLHEHELTQIRERFLRLERSLSLQCLTSYLTGLMHRQKAPTPSDIQNIEDEVNRVSKELKHFWNVILEANEPQVLANEQFASLATMSAIKVVLDQDEVPLLTPHEIEMLSIRKGSLSAEERHAIEQHVSHSYNFLLQIPWTADLADIADIVHAHHEHLDGSGYPRKLRAGEFPVQAQIMAVCDIYDALIAMDRPYKKALPHPQVMGILESEVEMGKLSRGFYNLFRDKEIYRLILNDDLQVAS